MPVHAPFHRPSKANRADRRVLAVLAFVLIVVALGALASGAVTLRRGVVDMRSRHAAVPVYVHADEEPLAFYSGELILLAMGGGLLYVGIGMARHAVRPPDEAEKMRRPAVPTRRRRPQRRGGG